MELPPYEEFEYKVFNSEKTFPIHSSGIIHSKQENFRFVMQNFSHSRTRSLMSHSPNSHRDMFELKESDSNPASTSKDCDRGDNLLKGSALVDATDSVPVNNTYAALHNGKNIKYMDGTLPCIADADKVPLAENEDLPVSSGTSEDQKDSSKLSEETNKTDDSWSPKPDNEPENEEDLCLKCLYVSMKCCECTIM